MRNFFQSLENDNGPAASCYGMSLVCLILIIAIKSPVLPIVMVCIAAAIGLLASRQSRFRFHAFQAGLMIVVYYVLVEGVFRRVPGESENLIAALQSLAMTLATEGITAVFIIISSIYLPLKTLVGKDPHFIGVGTLAQWLAKEEWEMDNPWTYIVATIAAFAVYMALTVSAVPTAAVPVTRPVTTEPDFAAAVSTKSFGGFPWGTAEVEVEEVGKELGLKVKPALSDGRVVRTRFAGYPAQLSLHFSNLDGTRQASSRQLWEGFVTILPKDAATEALYHGFHKKLTESFGPAKEMGYEPWRPRGSLPDGPGLGARWETTHETGRKMTIDLALRKEKGKTTSDPETPDRLILRYSLRTPVN